MQRSSGGWAASRPIGRTTWRLATACREAPSPNFPGIFYSGRRANDPLNTLPQTETQLIAGAGSQTNLCGGAPCFRWGDYSSMSVDPADDCTFWVANQYYSSQANGTSGNWQTRIGSFKFPSCAPVPTIGPLTPSSPTTPAGTSQAFSVVITNANGFAHLTTINFVANSSLSKKNGAYLTYTRATNTLGLFNDAGTAQTTCTAGTAGTISNSQVSVNCGATTAVGAGKNTTFSLVVTPTGAFSSTTPKKIWINTNATGGASSGFFQKGTWLIQDITPPTVGAVTPASPSTSTHGVPITHHDEGQRRRRVCELKDAVFPCDVERHSLLSRPVRYMRNTPGVRTK